MPTTLSPEEADRIATEHFAPVQRCVSEAFPAARVARVAELPGARDRLPADAEPSVQELAALLARYSPGTLFTMCDDLERNQEGGFRNYLRRWLR